MKRYERSYAIGNPFGTVVTHRTESGTYKTGVYISELGMCQMYSQQWTDGKFSLSVDVYVNGIGHYLTLERKKEFTDRSIIIFAGKFQREVHEKIKQT